MNRSIVIHYGEIGIKGKNRYLFENRLLSNIREHLKPLGTGPIRRRRGHLIVEVGEADAQAVQDELAHISGIEFFFLAERVQADLPVINETAIRGMSDARGSFRVTVKRSDKTFPMTSQVASAKIGAAILEAYPELKVDLHSPDRVCYVEISDDGAYVGAKKVKGVGGLPVGSSGKLVSMISGGIDSPVASWMIQKRGATLHYVHFHNFPYTDKRSMEIVKELVKILNRNGSHARLSLFNLTPIQEEIVATCTPRFRVILYRRMMFRIAERVALREKAHGFVTGESLGQVASQTIENMKVVEAVTKLPILRPLVGMDKEEIIERAKKIGTYESSILPHSDCCSLFVPDSPATKAPEKLILIDEARLDIEKMVEDALKKEEVIDISASGA